MSTDDPLSDDPSPGRTADPGRLRALDRYDILDTPPEETFDRISDLAAGLFDAPIGLITFVGADRQWHKACVGFDVPELDLDTSFCVHALGDAQRLVVEDATEDERFEDNPLVTGDRHVRFYAGSPMVTPDGHMLGTVCVLDTEPRSPTEQKLEHLDHLAQMAVDRLEERRRHRIEPAEKGFSLDTIDTRLNELIVALDDVVWAARLHPSGPTDADPVRSEILYTNSSEERVYGRPTSAFVQDPMLWRSAAHPADETDLPTIETLLAQGQWTGEYRILRPNGTTRWVETSIQVVGQPPRSGAQSLEDLEASFKVSGITRDIHRRKQAEASVRAQEQALAEETERLQLALEAAGAGVFEWHIPEDDRVWDESVQRMFGLDRAPRSTGELLEQLAPEDQGRLQKAMGSVLEDPDTRVCEVEYRVPTPDGSDRHVRARGLITRNDEGEATKITGFYQDRTETVERRQGLRRNERRFEAVFQDPGLFAGLLDLEGTLRRVNDTALDPIDAGRDDVVGRPFWETPWWDHDPSLQADLREWIGRAAKGEYVSYESDHVTGDGLTFTVRGSIRPVTDEDGTVTSLLVSGRDVTRREDQRRELEGLHQAVEDAADGIAVLAGEEYVYVDQTHADMYGFDDKEQLLGKSWKTLYGEIETQRLEETVFPVLREKGHWQGFVTGSRPDGSTFPAELSLTLSQENRLVCTVRDMTERRREERRRELLLTASAIGIAEWNVDTDEVHWDEMLTNIFGRAPKTFAGFAEIVHPTDRTRVEERLQSVVEDNTSWSGEFRIEDGQGRTRWIGTMVIPVREGDGTMRVLATGEDITERKAMQAEITRRERQFRMMFEQHNAPMLLIDEESGQIERANKAALQFYGYARDALTSMSIDEINQLSADSVAQKRKATTERGGDAFLFEHKLASGAVRTVRVLSAPIPNEDGGTTLFSVIHDVTKQETQRRALRRANQRFEQFAEAVPEAFFIASAEYDELLYLNSTAEMLYGVDAEALRDDPSTWMRHVHPADLPALQSIIDDPADVETDGAWHQELRVEHPTRGRRWLSLDLRALPSDTPDVSPRIACTATDITERKMRERWLQTLYRATQSLLDPSTETQAARTISDALGGKLGLEKTSVYLRDDDTLRRVGTANGGKGGSVPRVEKGHTPLWTALETGASQVYPEPSTIDDGIDRSDLETCAYVPLGHHGALVVGTADQGRLDEAEIQFVETIARSLRKALDSIKGERALVVSERRYRTLAENVPNGAVLLFDDSLTYTLAAGELIEEYGLGESDLVGEQAGSVLDRQHQSVVEGYRAALDGERTDQRVGIGDRTLRIHIVPLEGESESAGLLLAQDVTEDARRERELVVAKEAAEAADQMKSALLANMSHEIRTPLTSILGFAEVIGEEVAPDDTVAHFASLIEKGGRRLMNTLESVLNLSKLEGGDHVLSEKPVDVLAEARAVLDELQPEADEKGVALSIEEPDETPPRAQADVGGVQLVARNLVKNATKYTEVGGTVEVRVRPDGDAVVLVVEDNGIGIGEKALPHIFEPFRQESEGLGREYEGVGLGLAIVKQAVQKMGGRIEVETEVGEGSCFTVHLPLSSTDSP